MKLDDKTKADLKKLVAEITNVPEEKLTPEAKFVEELGIDSMMALEIVAATEKKFRVVIPEEEIPKSRSLGDIHKLLEKLLK